MFYWIAFHLGANVLFWHKHNLCRVAFQLRKMKFVGSCCHLRGADSLGSPLLVAHMDAEGRCNEAPWGWGKDPSLCPHPCQRGKCKAMTVLCSLPSGTQ